MDNDELLAKLRQWTPTRATIHAPWIGEHGLSRVEGVDVTHVNGKVTVGEFRMVADKEPKA